MTKFSNPTRCRRRWTVDQQHRVRTKPRVALLGPFPETRGVGRGRRVRVDKGVVLMRSIASTLLLLLVVLLVAGSASAAQLIDRDARGLTLRVNGKGEALLSYVSDGQEKHVLVWGAINALPPSPSRPQAHFQVDYSGGWGKYHHQLFAGEVY